MLRLNGSILATIALGVAVVGGQSSSGASDVRTTVTQDAVSISNGRISATWPLRGGQIGDGTWSAGSAGAAHSLGTPFRFTLADGSDVSAADMTLTAAPRSEVLGANAGSSRLVDRFAGRQVSATFTSPKLPGPVTWRAILRGGSAYVRQSVTIGPVASDVSVTRMTLVSVHIANAHVVGTVQGSPVATPDGFFGVEHPMSTCRVDGDAISCSLARTIPIRAGQSVEVSSVVGAAELTQLRRTFLAYLERERVHPYRPFLHYNSWYDLGYFTPYTEADALNVVNAFGEELVKMRGVVLSSFLFDDGWDSHKTLWKFNDGFPNGFKNVRFAAEIYGAEPGVWMSPFGGYGDPRTERLTYGKQEGFETNERGFALSGPVYYKRFRDTCLDMIRRFGINQFKFDGIGRATGVVAGSDFGSDFEAAIHLIRDELRAVKPDIFVNLTTGTWPSPFWLDYADSIWRGGEDHSFAGVGTKRQQWITYRDAQTFKNVVNAGPLFPLSSLMLHGLIYAQHAQNLDTDPGDDFGDEVRAYFGTGTELQEMYITPSLLSPENWDAIAESAKWARANADVLADTHWIGGDPARLDVYGHAAWTSRLGIVVLRNPSDKPAAFDLDVASAFELPAGAATTFAAKSPWRSDRGKAALTLTAGRPTTIALTPFEVLTLEATPVRGSAPGSPGPLRSDAAIVCASCDAWNAPMQPFKVFGNTYYVGTAGLSSILVTSADGLILLDGALPQSAPAIDAHIRALGFKTEDVRLILSSHAHFDHAGGIHALQQFTGATVAASAMTARALERGNLPPDDPQFALGPVSTAFPAVATVRQVVDGQTLRVGDLAVTAHLTPGHTPGSTTWTWQACEGARCVNVVYADSLNAVSADGFRFTGDATHPSIEASFRASIAKVEQLPCDVLLSVHPDAAHLTDKFKRRAAERGSNPFVDPGACRAYAADARATLDNRVAAERRGW